MARPKKIKKAESVEEILTDDKPIVHNDTDVMECKCLKAFTDKYTETIYEVGKVYKFTFKRIKEIKSKNEKLIEIIEK